MICDGPGWQGSLGRRSQHPGSPGQTFSPRPPPQTETRCSPCGSEQRLCSAISSAAVKMFNVRMLDFICPARDCKVSSSQSKLKTQTTTFLETIKYLVSGSTQGQTEHLINGWKCFLAWLVDWAFYKVAFPTHLDFLCLKLRDFFLLFWLSSLSESEVTLRLPPLPPELPDWVCSRIVQSQTNILSPLSLFPFLLVTRLQLQFI